MLPAGSADPPARSDRRLRLRERAPRSKHRNQSKERCTSHTRHGSSLTSEFINGGYPRVYSSDGVLRVFIISANNHVREFALTGGRSHNDINQ